MCVLQTDFPTPTDPRMNLRSPDNWKAKFTTNVGEFTVLVHREWSPKVGTTQESGNSDIISDFVFISITHAD
jgi:hypothetical protein